MAADCCLPAVEQIPAWRLEEMVGCQPSWHLEVLLPSECPAQSEWHVHLNDAELQLEVCGGTSSRWRLPVPGYAQPVNNAKCTLSRRRRKLQVQWPQQAKEEALADITAAMDNTMHKEEWEVQSCTSMPAVSATDVNDSTPSTSLIPSSIKEQACADTSATDKQDGDFVVEVGDSSAQECDTGAAHCYYCGQVATQCCTRCRLVWYCSRRCQRAHWASDHKTRCQFVSKIVCAEKQRHRGDAELALLTLKESMSAINSALKAEADKELTHDTGVVVALLRAFAATAVVMGATVAEESVPDDKLCQATFYSAATLMDMAANLGEKPNKPRRRPQELQFHVDNIIAGLEGKITGDADPVLSAWNFYNGFSVGMSESMSRYWKKVPKLRVGAIIAFRDVLAASHDLLEASGSDADRRAAARADRLLDLERLKVSAAEFKHLRPYMPRGQSNDVMSWASSEEGSEGAEEA
mmetsp:Transcript_4810/g.8729  ORF Transcript_4810/g.8729 Transcript_4810/m.8729 type:complete len:466 (+) Transcript_4810:51-1448(+)